MAVAAQDVLVALCRFQRLREERAEAGLLLLFRVLQPDDLRLGVPARRPRLHRPAAVAPAVRAPEREPAQERPLCGRGRGALALQPDGLHVLQVVQAVDVDAAAAVVVLARQLEAAFSSRKTWAVCKVSGPASCRRPQPPNSSSCRTHL